jgi:hemoglobin
MCRRLTIVTIIAVLLLGSFNTASAITTGPDKKKSGKKMSGKKMAGKPLYERLGGKEAITAVVDEFVARVAADNRINGFFAGVASDPKRLADFKGKLVDQICQASGGPCTYKGADMKTAHKGMGVTEAAFGALVEDLIAALDKFNVPAAEKNELLGLLGPMKGDIVEK